jgi:hypothetical protein
LIQTNSTETAKKITAEEVINLINFWSANDDSYEKTKKAA